VGCYRASLAAARVGNWSLTAIGEADTSLINSKNLGLRRHLPATKAAASVPKSRTTSRIRDKNALTAVIGICDRLALEHAELQPTSIEYLLRHRNRLTNLLDSIEDLSRHTEPWSVIEYMELFPTTIGVENDLRQMTIPFPRYPQEPSENNTFFNETAIWPTVRIRSRAKRNVRERGRHK